MSPSKSTEGSDRFFRRDSTCGISKSKTILNVTLNGNDEQKKTYLKRGRRVFRAFLRFRQWRRKKRRMKVRFDDDDEIICKEKSECAKNDYLHSRKMIKKRPKRGQSKSFERIEESVTRLPMGSRLKTRIVKLMRRRRLPSVTSKSIVVPVTVTPSRRSVTPQKRKMSAVGVILRRFVTLRRKTGYSGSDRPSRPQETPVGERPSWPQGEPPTEVVARENCAPRAVRKFKKRRGIKWRRETPDGIVLPEEKCANWLNHHSPLRVVWDRSCVLSERELVSKNRNKLKQKLIKILQKFKKAGVVESASLAGKMSSGDTGVVELIDLMEKLSLDHSSQVLEDLTEVSLTDLSSDSLSTSDFTLPKPRLRPFFKQEPLHFYCDQDERKFRGPSAHSSRKTLFSHRYNS